MKAVLHAVKSRIKSVQNIKKITSAMKMVAASKMKKAQTQQEQAVGVPKPFLKLFGEETSVFHHACAHALTSDSPCMDGHLFCR